MNFFSAYEECLVKFYGETGFSRARVFKMGGGKRAKTGAGVGGGKERNNLNELLAV